MDRESSTGYTEFVEKRIAIFDTPAAADQADRAYYAGLHPQKRLDILLALVSRYRESLGAADRFERVHRVVELSQS
jgi:hypothetical protein